MVCFILSTRWFVRPVSYTHLDVYKRQVVISVDELEKEWKERVDECVGQRVNVPLICDEPRCSKMLLLEGKRPLLMKDLNYLPFLYKFVPSVWNNVIWCYDERDLDRELCVDKEIELYRLQRNYNELKEMLNDLKYLPVKIAVSYTHLDVYKRQGLHLTQK